jgi:hypothetical protein
MAARKSGKAPEAKTEYVRTAREAEAVRKFQEGVEQAPRFKVTKEGHVVPDHPDAATGVILLAEALGTTDPDFVIGLVGQLADASSKGGKIPESDLNFMLSVIKDIKPRDQLEAMLAAQMAGVHIASMNFLRHLAGSEFLEHRDSADRTLNKLMRTFVTQLEALKRYRTGSEQNVTVQQVNVSEGGQAIVGNVTQGQREAPPSGTAAPPLTLSHDKTAPMPVIESTREDEIPMLVATLKKK